MVAYTVGCFHAERYLFDPINRTVGHPDSDLYPHLWGYWRWIRKWDAGGFAETWSNTEPFLNVPFTGDLYHVDWLNGLIVWLGTTIGMPLLLSVNAMILIQWTDGHWRNRLSKRLNLTFWATLFILCCLDTTPFLERFVLHSAVFERLNLGWVLLYLYCLLGLIQEQRWYHCIGGIVIFWTGRVGFLALCTVCHLKQCLDSLVAPATKRTLWKPLLSLALVVPVLPIQSVEEPNLVFKTPVLLNTKHSDFGIGTLLWKF